MMLACETTFVARGFSARPQELAEIIKQAILHPGFAFIEIISPCVTFLDTYALYKQRVAPIPETHDRTDRMAALALSFDTEKTYLGIFYQDHRPRPHHEALKEMREKLSDRYSLQSLLERFRR
jgi:2-oxoglutarate ferredoxin oxidoreductase subunit beta